jgi:hypothetical protein
MKSAEQSMSWQTSLIYVLINTLAFKYTMGSYTKSNPSPRLFYNATSIIQAMYCWIRCEAEHKMWAWRLWKVTVMICLTVLPQHSYGLTEKCYKKSVRIASSLKDIWTWHAPNTSLINNNSQPLCAAHATSAPFQIPLHAQTWYS